MILARRHLLTDLLQACIMAAGESSLKDHEAPRSSTVSCADVKFQPSRVIEAIRAVTGPVTSRHGELALPSFR